MQGLNRLLPRFIRFGQIWCGPGKFGCSNADPREGQTRDGPEWTEGRYRNGAPKIWTENGVVNEEKAYAAKYYYGMSIFLFFLCILHWYWLYYFGLAFYTAIFKGKIVDVQQNVGKQYKK